MITIFADAAIVGKRRLMEPAATSAEMDTKPLALWSQGTQSHQGMARGSASSHVSQAGRGGLLRDPSGLIASGRGRGLGRSTILPQRPVSNFTAVSVCVCVCAIFFHVKDKARTSNDVFFISLSH